jgi:hypothetical protein
MPEAATAAERVQVSERPEKPSGVTDKTWGRLKPRLQAFLVAYVQDGNALRAYEVAEYGSNGRKQDIAHKRQNAYSVTRGKAFQAAVLEHRAHKDELAQAKRDFSLDWSVQEHQRLMAKAEEAGDLAVATRNLELIGRTRGIYADTVQVDVAARREYSKAEQLEAVRLSRLLLTDGGGDAAPSDARRPPQVTGDLPEIKGNLARPRDEKGKFTTGVDERLVTDLVEGPRDEAGAGADGVAELEQTAAGAAIVGAGAGRVGADRTLRPPSAFTEPHTPSPAASTDAEAAPDTPDEGSLATEQPEPPDVVQPDAVEQAEQRQVKAEVRRIRRRDCQRRKRAEDKRHKAEADQGCYWLGRLKDEAVAEKA